MKTIITILALIPFLLASPAHAAPFAEDEPAARAFVTNNTTIIAVEVVLDNDSDAELAVIMADADVLEDALDITIVTNDTIPSATVRALGASNAALYGFIDNEHGEPGLLLMASEGTHLYLFVTMGDLEDMDPFAQFTWDVVQYGLEDADEPVGYLEIELEEDARTSTI